MQVYYVLAAVYGFAMWKFGRGAKGKNELPVTHFKRRYIVPAVLVTLVLWAAIYYFLAHHTDSRVPVLDSFTTAMCVTALWALAHKWVEQWLMWLAVDVVCTGLYFYKGIPFHAALYGFYSIMAVAGYIKWTKLARADAETARASTNDSAGQVVN